ncbi:apolipoprotein N-acyltransferase [Azorhizobium oxalatiphilum]|uniref:apolipoprotein N-acyltransferase n=1 Tax=Azorhizobium oxalatiphilum TaxID=980631 RepID=UPI001FCEEFDC|nr:apolipoprotein N-acyltransferase [Azorhizobium oxalatiphilum]
MTLASWVRSLTGWRRLAFAVAAGGFSALSTAPYGVWPVLAIGFPALILLIDGAGHARRRGRGAMLRAAAWAGWGFGFGYFLASLWWIGDAFLVEAEDFGWLLPFAVLLLPAGLALFMALGAVLARLAWPSGAGRICVFAVAFTISEWLRGHVLTGFPWNTFGYGPAATLELAQGAAVVGLWGLTFFALLLFATPVLLLRPGSLARRTAWPVAALVVLAGAYGAGAYRLATTPARFLEHVHLRLLQPAIPQGEKFAYDKRKSVLAGYLELSQQPSALYPKGLDDVSLLIWPESAFPFIYEREPWAKALIAQVLPQNVTLVTGAARLGDPPPGQTSSFFNSIRVMNARGETQTVADKVHLVPFGEYLPFQAFLESIGLEQLTRVRGGFSAGDRLRPLPLPGAPSAAPLICYEAIFPGAVVPEGERPGFLLNLTNDAWFGDTPGPHQHFLQARLRAVEEGLPLVRSANTGVSAIVDPLGRIVASRDLGARGVLDGDLPAALPTPPVGARLSSTILTILMLFTSLIAACAIWRHHTRIG